MKTISLLRHTVPGGIQSIWLLQQNQSNFVFMAKKELFSNRIFGWWIRMCGAFPIDRDNPGSSAIKYPINVLKKSNRSLIMFPSGSRHSNDVKGGVASLQRWPRFASCLLPILVL